jgi:hypothetical protein
VIGADRVLPADIAAAARAVVRAVVHTMLDDRLYRTTGRVGIAAR